MTKRLGETSRRCGEAARERRTRCRRWQVAALSAVALATASGATLAQVPTGEETTLRQINAEARALRRPVLRDGVADYSERAVAERAREVAELRRRFDALDASSWPVDGRIDYLLVRAQLNAARFELDVVRPWARDPGLAVDAVRRTPFAEVPEEAAAAERLRARLAVVPLVLERARQQLTEPSGELARMALRQLQRSDGVNQGEPRRDPPPEGVIGWYRDLLGRLRAADSDLVADAEAALQAVDGFRRWLASNESSMSAPAWVGLEQYDWYLRNVLLMPYDSRDLRVIAVRELARARTFLQIERHRNRGLPEIEPAATGAEHAARVEEAEALIRAFLAANELVTVPPELPERFETDAFWIVRPGGRRHFWEEITYRDPLNNHIHASIPGHRFDGLLQRRETRPIRRGYRDGVRSEGWAFYIEEMFLQAGLLDERPRARELFYIAQLKRAARIPAELDMQRGAIDLQGAIDYLIEQVPLMEEDLARYDLQIYLRRPTYGMNYVMGKVMLEKLLSDLALQQGDDFDLGVFHDAFLGAGPIPIALIRWEMTGLDDEIRELW